MNEEPPLDQFAIVELMGHVSMAGRIREESRFGAVMLRIDIPPVGEAQGFTQWISGGAIYRVSPVTEEAAMAYMERHLYTPPIPYDVRRQLTAAPSVFDGSEDGDYDESQVDDDGIPL